MFAVQVDLLARRISRLDTVAGLSALRADLLTDAIFGAVGTDIVPLFNGATRRTGVWRSPVMVRNDYPSFSWLAIEGPAESVLVNIYGEGALVYTSPFISDNEPRRFPPMRFREWQIEVYSQGRIGQVLLASSAQELRS